MRVSCVSLLVMIWSMFVSRSILRSTSGRLKPQVVRIGVELISPEQALGSYAPGFKAGVNLSKSYLPFWHSVLLVENCYYSLDSDVVVSDQGIDFYTLDRNVGA